MRMTRLDVVYEWKLIRKFQKWLYNLHMNPLLSEEMLKEIFEYNLAMLSFVHKRMCQPNTRKYGIKEDLNQNDNHIISRKEEQYQRFLQILIITIYVFTTRKDRLKLRSAQIVF